MVLDVGFTAAMAEFLPQSTIIEGIVGNKVNPVTSLCVLYADELLLAERLEINTLLESVVRQ
jgi:hypothetical protein